MKQPFAFTLAFITFASLLVAGMALIRSCNQDTDEYGSYTRPPANVVVGPKTSTDTELDEMWESVGWMAKGYRLGDEIKYAYVETAWAVGSDRLNTYFISCYHGIMHVGSTDLYIGYWDKIGEQWQFIKCTVVEKLYKGEGDLVLLSVLTSELSHRVPPLKVAKDQTFAVNDELLIGGVQHYGGPAYVTVGIVKMINMTKPEFVIKGWAWYGFSGGPVRLRRTGEVIGFVRAATANHTKDASESICGDFSLIHRLLQKAGLE